MPGGFDTFECTKRTQEQNGRNARKNPSGCFWAFSNGSEPANYGKNSDYNRPFSRGGRGKKRLTRWAYSAKSGCSDIFFSNKGMPETQRIKRAITTGPRIGPQPPLHELSDIFGLFQVTCELYVRYGLESKSEKPHGKPERVPPSNKRSLDLIYARSLPGDAFTNFRLFLDNRTKRFRLACRYRSSYRFQSARYG